MSVLTVEAKAMNVTIPADTLSVELSDGRTISVPLAWYPRLRHGSGDDLNNWRFIGENEGIHWLELDEDISVESLLLGNPSGESHSSLKRWLAVRETRSIGTRYQGTPCDVDSA